MSSGGLDPTQKITVGPGYQVPFARDVRTKAAVAAHELGIPAAQAPYPVQYSRGAWRRPRGCWRREAAELLR